MWFLDPQRGALIQETIKLFYLKPTKPSVARLVHEIRTRCLALGLPPPNWRTVKARITDLDTRAEARKRGESALLTSTMAVPGEYCASRPLEIVQKGFDDALVKLDLFDFSEYVPAGMFSQVSSETLGIESLDFISNISIAITILKIAKYLEPV